jgi:hypothetical protein
MIKLVYRKSRRRGCACLTGEITSPWLLFTRGQRDQNLSLNKIKVEIELDKLY